LDKFEILPDKISAIVHENGANIVAAARLLEEKYGWASLRCTGHTLQLFLTFAFKRQIIAKRLEPHDALSILKEVSLHPPN